jgi:hypothetical protein
MAQIIANKYPIDTEARKAVGFGLPINGDAVFVPTYTTADQIKANLVNWLLTNKGERILNPEFGADLKSLLFEQVEVGLEENLKFTIQNSIKNYFPMVKVKELDFITNPDENTTNFILTYEIVLFGIEDTVNILLQ